MPACWDCGQRCKTLMLAGKQGTLKNPTGADWKSRTQGTHDSKNEACSSSLGSKHGKPGMLPVIDSQTQPIPGPQNTSVWLRFVHTGEAEWELAASGVDNYSYLIFFCVWSRNDHYLSRENRKIIWTPHPTKKQHQVEVKRATILVPESPGFGSSSSSVSCGLWKQRLSLLGIQHPL